MPKDCRVCGDPVDPDADKFADDRPVYGPDPGDVHHLGCEDEVFEETFCEADP